MQVALARRACLLRHSWETTCQVRRYLRPHPSACRSDDVRDGECISPFGRGLATLLEEWVVDEFLAPLQPHRRGPLPYRHFASWLYHRRVDMRYVMTGLPPYCRQSKEWALFGRARAGQAGMMFVVTLMIQE